MKKYIDRLMVFLVELNYNLYGYRFHIPLFILLIAGLLFGSPLIKGYLGFGLFVYFILIIIRSFQDRKKDDDDLKPINFLVGFNLCLLLSFFSFFIILWLNKNVDD